MSNTPGAGVGYERLEAVYRDAQVRLETMIRAATLKGNEWTEHRAKLQLIEVQRIQADLLSQAATLAHGSVGTAYQAGVNAVDFHTLGGLLSTGVNTQAVAVLAQALTTTLEGTARHVGRQAVDVFQQLGVHHAAVGIATGATRPAVAKGLANDLRAQGISGFTDNAGRRWSLSSYTNMVARTTTREAVSLATRERLEHLGLDLVTISDHGETDEICDEFAGNTYSLSGDTSGYDTLPEEPPFHPNCIHVMTPAEANQDSFLEALENGVPEGLEVHTAEIPSTPMDVLSSGLPAQTQRERLRQLGSLHGR